MCTRATVRACSVNSESECVHLLRAEYSNSGCYFELAPNFCKIFHQCLLEGKIPKVWKLSAISPLPKKSNPKSNNDYRRIALTSVIMKLLKKIIKEKRSK